jgi:ornithine cyclodeaminase/alanine dehydrogenase-like protein (mu-crystallin family)
MLILRNGDLIDMLSMNTAIGALNAMLHEQAAGSIELPQRTTVDADSGAWLRLMPAVHNQRAMMGYKSISRTPGHGMRGFIGLIDTTDGDVVALLDADYITTLRTSAIVAIATSLFAPETIETMALLGSGSIAEGVLNAVAAVRSIPQVRVYSPNAEHRATFAQHMSARHGIDVRPVGSPQEAIRPANLICGAFRAPATPAIEAGDLRGDAHLNSLSSVRADAREVANDVWRICSCVCVDHRAGVAQSGDGLSVLRDHPFDLERAPELWEIVRDGRCRTRHDGVTMFKSVGAANQDIALAILAYGIANERGVGERIADFPSSRARR